MEIYYFILFEEKIVKTLLQEVNHTELNRRVKSYNFTLNKLFYLFI